MSVPGQTERKAKKMCFNSLNKIKLKQNSKVPAMKGWQKPENQKTVIDTTYNNVGIPTGAINNIIVVDVDNIEEFQIILIFMANR